jgi:PAS domain S-box-containing protein
LQELKKQAAVQAAQDTKKTVTVFIQSNLFVLSGAWEWNLNSDAVYCSDVILSLPPSFEGTKAIIHPDDLSFVKEIIAKEKGKIDHLKFRIITTYGEVKVLSCDAATLEKIDNEEDLAQAGVMQQATTELVIQKEYESLQLQKEISERSEKFTGSGIWYYNSATNETWYSSHVFRIYNLPPQSLNAHLNTFTSFIHPEDKEQVIEYTTRAFKYRTPLHIHYRVVTTAGERLLYSATHWFFNTKGEEILSGTLQDVTEQRTWEQNIEEGVNAISFFRQQLVMDEQQANIAHWQVHLLTRKTVFSDNYYRIFGLKPNSLPAGFRHFTNYIHPEDRDLVAFANKKMIYEHVPPEIEYRIVRSDGKLRYMSQKAKLVTYGNEMVIVGLIQDVTVQKMLEKKIAELSEKETIRNFTSQGMEEMAGIASWVWEITTGEIAWSDNFYRVLGYKPHSIELSQKLLLAYIHPEDQKKFKDNQNLALGQNQETEFEFRLVHRGNIKYMKASFRVMQNKEANLFIGTIQDVTREALLQKQLQQRIQLAEALSENILDRVIITDTNNNILSWNKECERIYEVKKDDAIGANFFDVFPQLKMEAELQLFSRVLKGEKISAQGLKSHLGKGYYNLNMMPLWDEEQTEITGIIHIIHDITKEYELRHNLNARLNFISSLLEASVDRIIALDSNMNYLYWNKKAEEYYGLDKKDVVGKNILEVFPNVVNDPSYGEFRKVLKGEVVHMPASKNSEEQKEYFETYLIPIKDEDGDVSGVLWIAHDLTREYKLQLQHAKEHEVLEALNENYYELDSDYRIVYVNQNGLHFLNSRQEDVIGKLMWEAFPKVIDTPFFSAVKKAMEEGTSTRTEIKSPTTERWMSVSIAPTADGVVILSYDIEHIKLAQEKLEQNKEILEAVFNASLHGLCVFKTIRNEKGEIEDFEIVMNNEVTKKWNGRSLVGERYAEIFPGIKENGIFEGFKKVIQSGESLDMEVLYEGQGLKNWYHITAVKLEDGLVATAEDISQRKNALGDLTRSKDLLEQTTSATPDAVTVYDLVKKEPVYLNNCLGEWTGYSNAELLSMGFEGRLQLIHPDDRQKLFQFNGSMLEAKDHEVKMVEYRLQTRNGLVWIRNRSKVFERDNTGEPVKILSVLQDISEEVKLRNQLLESTQYAEKIIDASVNRIHAVDAEMKIIAWNRRAEEITGIRKEEAIGKKIFDLFPQLGEDEIIRKAYEDSIAGNYVHLPPKQSVYSQGIYERFFIPLKNNRGEVSSVVNILLDVSNLVHKEQELKELNKTLEQKNRELEQKNEEITTFAFVASHDLKEPLRKIHTFSDWLLEKETSQLSKRGAEYLQRMNLSVQRLNLLIEDILVLTKIHSDQNKTDSVDLNAVLALVKEDLIPVIKEKNAIIKSNKLPVLHGNRHQLFYLFRNLLDNAIKFQPPNQQPMVEVRSEIVEGTAEKNVHLKEGREYIKLSFSDNGIGFDKKYKTKIFQVFQQLKEIPQGGTGMGLAICKKVVENHEGVIVADSEVGKGSVFCCYFPL